MELTKEFLQKELVDMQQQRDQLHANFLRADGICAALSQLLNRLEAPDEPTEEGDPEMDGPPQE